MHVCICEPQGELDQGALRSRMRPSWAWTWFHSRCDQDTRISEEQQVALLDCPDQWVYPPQPFYLRMSGKRGCRS